MRALLEAMKVRAIQQLPNLNGEQGVHLLIDEDMLPETTPFPCIGLKDLDVTNHYNLSASPPKKILTVDIIGYVQINSPEGAIIGKNAEPGILDLMEDVVNCFAHWSPDGYRWMNGDVLETGSTYMAALDKLVQKKKVTMTWHRRAA